MNKKIKPDQLDKEIDAILADYESGVIRGAKTAIQKLANKGRNAVRRYARAQFKRTTTKGTTSGRKYSNGWMYKMVGASNKWAAGAVIYEAKQPGLAHLLEHGHAKEGGGRTKAKEHIKPVDDQLAREAISAVIKEI